MPRRAPRPGSASLSWPIVHLRPVVAADVVDGRVAADAEAPDAKGPLATESDRASAPGNESPLHTRRAFLCVGLTYRFSAARYAISVCCSAPVTIAPSLIILSMTAGHSSDPGLVVAVCRS